MIEIVYKCNPFDLDLDISILYHYKIYIYQPKTHEKICCRSYYSYSLCSFSFPFAVDADAGLPKNLIGFFNNSFNLGHTKFQGP